MTQTPTPLNGLAWVLLLCQATLACSAPCHAEVAEYRRIFVPADAPELWPVGIARYLPISKTRFDALLKSARLGGSQDAGQAVRIRGATYQATLDSSGQLRGSAIYGAELPGTTPQVLSLEPLNLAITAAAWEDDPGHAEKLVQIAKLGAWNLEPDSLKIGILVNRSDRLRLEGSWPALASQSSQAEFLLKTPAAVPQIFRLILSPDRSAQFSPGELIETELTPEGNKLWLFHLTPSSSHRLTITRPAQLALKEELPRVSQSTSYHLEASGVTIVSQFRFEACSTAGDLRFFLPDDMKLVSASVDHVNADWQTLPDEAGKTQLLLRRPPSSQPQLIEVRSHARLSTNHPWTLPRLRPQNVSWTEGTTSLLVAPMLELRALTPSDASLQHIVGLAVEAGEVYRVQEWSKNASLEIDVAPRQARLRIRSATTTSWGPSELSARTAARLTGDGPGIFKIEAEVTRGWSIESVETLPNIALQEWHTYREEDRKMLRVQLAQPLVAAVPMQLEINARASPSEISLPSKVGQLKPLRFLQAEVEQELLLLANRQGEQKELPPRLQAAHLRISELPAQEAALLPVGAKGILVDLTDLDEFETIELLPRPSNYDARVNITVSAMPDMTWHHYRIDCSPRTGSISKIVVQLDTPLPETIGWELVGQSGTVLVDRRREELQAQTDSLRAATYALRFPIALDKPFQVQARYSVPRSNSLPCNLLQLPEATTWHGQIVLRGSPNRVRVLDGGWTRAIATAAGFTESRWPPILGCYRLDAASLRRQVAAKPLTIEQSPLLGSPDTVSSALVAWRADYNTLQASDGTAIYVAAYQLENLGAESAHLNLPEGAELEEAWLQGQHFTPEEIFAVDGHYQFRFNDSAPWQTLVVKYVSRGSALGQSARITPALPQCSFPINLSRWTLWTPQQYVIDEDLVHPSNDRRWWNRLFGPLARSSQNKIFNPIRGSDWNNLWSTPLGSERTKRVAEKLARQCVVLRASEAVNTWGDLFRQLALELRIEDLLRLDQVALANVGIFPDITVENNPLPDSKKHAAESACFAAQTSSINELAFVATHNAIIVTSQERVAHWRHELHASSSPGVFWADSEGLDQSIFSAINRHDSEILQLTSWLRSLRIESSPWDAQATRSQIDMSRNAWTVEFANTPPPVTIYRVFVQRALWYAVWLLAVVLGCWQHARQRAGLMLMILLGAAICLIVTPRWLAISQAAFLGLLAAVVVQLAWRNLLPKRSRSFLIRSSSQSAIAILLIIALQGGHATEVFSQSPDGNGDASRIRAAASGSAFVPDLPRVLLPIDAAGSVQGEDVFIDEDFLKKLNSLSSPKWPMGAQSVVLSAAYRGAIPQDVGLQEQSKNGIPWSLSLTIETFGEDTRLDLPLQDDQADWLANSHRLNGLPVKLVWRPEGDGCHVNLGRIGIHQLELFFQPVYSQQGQRTRLRMQIPHCPGAQLELLLPPEIDGLSLADVAAPPQSLAAGNWTTVVPSQGDLRIAWSTRNALDDSAWAGNIEQLSWLQVSPTSSLLEVLLLIESVPTAPRAVYLQKSPHLKVREPEADSPVASIAPLLNEPDVLRLALKEGLGADLRIPLQFELQRSVSIGCIFFPSVRLLDNVPTRHLFAVSVASDLSYDERLSKSLRNIAPNEFSAAWNSSGTLPLFAYSLDKQDPQWSLNVWPAPKTFTVQQTMRVDCQLKRVGLEYEAAVDEIAGHLLMHRLKVPSNFSIDSIGLRTQYAKEPVPIRWSRESDTKVVVFLGRPLSQPHLLTVRGERKLETSGAFELPTIGLIGAERNAIRMNLYRSKDVLVRWADPERAPKEVSEQRLTHGSSNILVGHYAWRADKLSEYGMLHVKKNRNKFSANSCVTLTQNHADWTATLHAHVKSTSGVLDHIGLTVPGNFSKNCKLLPEEAGSIGKIDDSGSERQITILLSEPLLENQEIDLHLSGILSLLADQRLEVPDLRVLRSESSSRYVLLPTQADGKSIDWQPMRGLRKQAIPSVLREVVGANAGGLPFRVVEDTFFAKERTQRGALLNPAVNFAVLTGVVDRQGAVMATAELVVQPGSATHCTLRLPPQSRLSHLLVGGQHVHREPAPDGGWMIPLGPSFMPIKVEATYSSLLPVERAQANFQLSTPKILIGQQVLPISTVYWRLRWSGGTRFSKPVKGQKISAFQFAEQLTDLRTKTIVGAMSRLLELPLEEGQAWFATWTKGIDPATKRNAFPVLTEQFKAEQLVELAAAPKQSHPPKLTVLPTAQPFKQEIHYVADSDGLLILTSQTVGIASIWKWFASLACVSMGVAFLIRLQAATSWHLRLQEYRYGLTFTAGCFYWLLLQPSALGLLLMTVVVMSLAQREWRRWRRKRRQKTSTQFTARAV